MRCTGLILHTQTIQRKPQDKDYSTPAAKMSDELISSLYPPPPPYYKLFTAENLEKYAEWQKAPHDSDAVPPGELRFQVPPEISSNEQYRGYGSVWSTKNTLPLLVELGWKQLYPDEDETITSQAKIDELHKLLDSLLLNFLELVASVSVEPAKFHFKIEHLKLILINMNHLLNTYRPHQTRESLIMLLQEQINSKKEEIKSIEDSMNEVKKKIADLVSKGGPDDISYTEATADAPKPDEQKVQLERLRQLLQN